MVKLSLGAVIGRALADFSGLGHVHLPEGVGLDVAQEIVATANQCRPLKPPFALLVAPHGAASSVPSCPVVTAKESISYRQGHHVAVVFGRQPDLASFVQTFREISGQSYPEGASGLISMKRLASVATGMLAEVFQVQSAGTLDRAAEIVFDCLFTAREVHAAGDSGLRGWNSIWFDHVDAGLKNLESTMERLRASGSGHRFDEAVGVYARACFALPMPSRRDSLMPTLAEARAMNESLHEYWSDEESFTLSLRQIAIDAGLAENGPLANLKVDGLDGSIAAEGDVWLALAKVVGANQDGIEAISRLSQKTFLNPSGMSLESVGLELYSCPGTGLASDVEGRSLAISDESASPFIVRLSVDALEGGRQPQSDRIELRIPWGGSTETEPPAIDEVTVDLRPASAADWTTLDVVPSTGHISVIGRLRRKGRTGANNRAFRSLNLSVSVAKSSSSAHLTPGTLSSTLYVFDASEPFLLIGSIKSKGALGGLKFLGPSFNGDPQTEFAEELPPAQNRYCGILWFPNAQEPPRLDGEILDEHPAVRRLFTIKFDPTGDNEFVAGAYVFRVRPVAAGGGQQSALLAAALKQQVTPDRPSTAAEASIRGQAEAFYAERLSESDDEVIRSLGHILMPANMAARLADVTSQDGGAILAGPGVRKALESNSWISFKHDDFINSAPAHRMRTAIDAMDFGRRLTRVGADGAHVADWPSRTAWRSLWTTDELQEYLDAYCELLAAARTSGHDSLVFWAAYPMSVSVWDVRSADGCLQVLLSPLHPVRLAWLAGVERTLYDAERALEHLGAIEGWNFPMLGPGEEANKRFIAVPTDSGGEQLFLGWSTLVPASTGSPKALAAPERIGSVAAPGTAVSGLNSTSVDAALRSFRKMHPHLTTLTVDLSARETQARLNEIDEAVLAVAKEWGGAGRNRLLGGVRVFDSVHRDGSAPRDGVTRLVRENHDIVLTWSRYAPDREDNRSCNIRFLQDAGSTISVANGGRKLGVVGNVPLRRFEASSGTLVRHHSSSEPSIATSTGWAPFTAALSALESPDATPVVRAGMLRRDVNDASADWTVLGESFLNPAVLAELMAGEGDGTRMLWEWRPPVFERNAGIPNLERRPFVSVARVPDSFGSQLNDLLMKATGGENFSELRREVMSTLGGRGVGLSSLLSMGGTHVAGALGFFLVFALFEGMRSGSSTRLVMPIDASDYFLRTLAGQNEHGRHQRRADLVYMDLSDEELVLVPVEIKSYGLQSAVSDSSEHLPELTSTGLREPLEQLRASDDLFRSIEARSEEMRGADAELWRNSLATLLETAIRLNPGHNAELDQLMARLARVVDGTATVRAGNPVVAYFKHDALTAVGDVYASGLIDDSELEAYGLVANTAAVFQALDDSQASLRSDWERLINAAVSRGSTHDVPVFEQDHESHPDIDVHRHPRQERDGDHVYATASESGIHGDGVRLHIGTVLGSLGKKSVDYWTSNTALTQMNVGVVGDLGTGKTEFVKSFVAQTRHLAFERQPGEATSGLILDYKGDFQSKEFLDRVGGVVVEPYKIPLNIFMPATSEHSRRPYQQAAAFVDTLTKIYGGVGPVQAAMLNESIRRLYADRRGDAPILTEVREAYEERSGKPDSVSSLLDRFVFGEIFEDRRENLKSFRDLLEGRVVVVALDKLGQDTGAKNALIALFLNLYYDFMIRSEKPPFQGKDPQLRYVKSFLVVDEAINIMRYNFTVLMDLMLQGRQFGFGVVLSAQYLSHFMTSKENYGQPLRTWVIHRVPEVTAKEFASLGLPNLKDQVVHRIPELERHEALYKSYGWDEGQLVRVMPYYELYGL